MEKIRVLAIGDGDTPTGFARVLHNIFSRLMNKGTYEIDHLAVNYHGDPHNWSWKMFPARLKGDLLGYNRIADFKDTNYDLIFILNDLWVLDTYLKLIKDYFKNIPKIVVYYPVDSENLDSNWFQNFDIVTKNVAYTQFGWNETYKAIGKKDTIVIPHGTDTSVFFKYPERIKKQIRQVKFNNNEDLTNSCIFLNANRNQPRKRIDLTIEGFAEFAKDKPENVKLYLHMGLKDMGWDILKLSTMLGIDRRIIISNTNKGIQQVSDQDLASIYNMCDIGINTSIGEGWGLIATEHAATGALQIVPNHSACAELFNDVGILIDAPIPERRNNLLVSKLPTIETVAEGFETAYDLFVNYKEDYNNLVNKGVEKFTSEELSWDKVAEDWDKLFTEVVNV